MHLEISDDETAALTRLFEGRLTRTAYPLSPRVRTLRRILDKIEPPPVRETPPPLKVYALPRAKPGQPEVAANCCYRLSLG